MKVAVLGASGRLGTQAMLAALNANHQVSAIVRQPSKLASYRERDGLTIVQGDIFDPTKMTQVLARHDAVISCLGFGPSPFEITGYFDAAKVTVSAMRDNDIKRLVLGHSWYTSVESQSIQPLWRRWTLLAVIKSILANMRKTELWLESECQDIDYTVVRPPGLTNRKASRKDLPVIFGGFEVDSARHFVARADVAKFMLDGLTDEKYFKQMIAVGGAK